ncbi:MAG: PD-(D/E)XK nuclease family protein [Aeromicrobium sp.]|uniref:RecB family exonuclease n=1 Tax=Aeromicrobium sp. TaxID=1871063 RepID=UPI0039E29EAD
MDSEVVVRSRLSPSRASDFITCPLLFRYRTVDKLPEPPAPAAIRGTLVHAVLEDLFDLPAAERHPDRAAELIAPAWDRVVGEDARAAEFSGSEDFDAAAWLDSALPLVESYFALENPQTLEPAAREVWVEHRSDDLTLGGIVDRLDIAPDGRIRVVDYKTGKAPSEHFEGKALFQMRFYALLLWRTRGIVPTLLQLMYLGDRQILRHGPGEAELVATERKVRAIWTAIMRALDQGAFSPSPNGLCRFCAFHDHCPAQGGTLLPMPTVRIEPPGS